MARLAVYQLGPAIPADDDARAAIRQPVHLAVLAGRLRVLLGNRVDHLPVVLQRRALELLLDRLDFRRLFLQLLRLRLQLYEAHNWISVDRARIMTGAGGERWD